MIRPEQTAEQPMTTTYIDFTRHGNRFGGKIAVTVDGKEYSFDDSKGLTPEGKRRATEFGTSYPEEVTLVHPRGGAEARHGETGDDIMTGTLKYGNRESPSPVRTDTGQVKGARQGKGVDYVGAGFDPFIQSMETFINAELNTQVQGLSREEKRRFVESPEIRAKYREQAQVKGFKKFMEEHPEHIKIVAENEAYELMHVVELSRRGVQAGEVKAIPIIGSGLFAESLFKYALVIEDEKTGEKKVGFDHIDEIGGFTKQATAFRMKLIRDTGKGNSRDVSDMDLDTIIEYEFTDPQRQEVFKGKKIYFDWEVVRKLAREAEKRLRSAPKE